MQNNTFQIPSENAKGPQTTGSNPAYPNFFESQRPAANIESDPLNLGRAVAELSRNQEANEFNERSVFYERTQAVEQAKYIINLRQRTSTDPDKAIWN